MKTSLLIVFFLTGLTIGLYAQIPSTWTQEKLKKIYDGPAIVAFSKSQVKSITFLKKEPASFHGGECFGLILTVLRGPDAPEIKADDPNIKVTEKGEVITWTDRLSGYSVTQAAEGFNFTARRNGKVTVTANWGEIAHGSKFVLANTGG